MNKTTEPAAPDLSRIEPIDYVYRGSDGLIYRTVPQHVPVIETIPRYSAATVEWLVQERDKYKDSVEHYGDLYAKLAAMTQERDEWQRQSSNNWNSAVLNGLLLATSQAREQQLREALSTCQCYSNKQIAAALALPQDDTALREWGAKLLEEMAMEIDLGTQETEDAAITLCRKAAELREGKK